MDVLRGADIERGLVSSGRAYLCGNLSQPNASPHVPTDGYEIGMSYYPTYTFEKPHIHSFNREYNYVLEGAIKILLIDEGTEHLFEAGDLFVININEPYVGKSLPGTRTIFSKVPGGNDKVLVELDEALIQWGSSWDATYPDGE